jgi:hypothetical protein
VSYVQIFEKINISVNRQNKGMSQLKVMLSVKYHVKGKGKGLPRTGHEGPEEE